LDVDHERVDFRRVGDTDQPLHFLRALAGETIDVEAAYWRREVSAQLVDLQRARSTLSDCRLSGTCRRARARLRANDRRADRIDAAFCLGGSVTAAGACRQKKQTKKKETHQNRL